MKNSNDIHIRIDSDISSIISTLAKQDKTSFNKELNILLKKGCIYNDVANYIFKSNIAIEKIVKRINNIESLLKQLYSDMEFSKCSDYKKSKSLNEFLKKEKLIDE